MPYLEYDRLFLIDVSFEDSNGRRVVLRDTRGI